MESSIKPIVILGAGINGAALARELVLNRVPVVVVDRSDIGSGTTAYSSRLIHGGLRYLEHGEFDLVRESLAERTRWLQLAPHLVRPLQLLIPVGNVCGGLWTAARQFVHFPAKKKTSSDAAPARGLITVRTGLWMYDRYARDRTLPKSHVLSINSTEGAAVNADRFRWLCSYMDAQVVSPERMSVELLRDAAQIAAESGVSFTVLTYHQAMLQNGTIAIKSLQKKQSETHSLQPAAIVNATGAWVDQTLAALSQSEKRLIGGTKGTHLVTFHKGLKEQLGGRGFYTEAEDGRPIFVLPFMEGTLVGTTDEPFTGDPTDALASDAELDYLVRATNDLLPRVALNRRDIALHYCGVRPLPYSDATTPAAITRRHWLHEHAGTSVLLFSVIGGKLTTCRSLAEEATKTILGKLGLPLLANSQERPLPGGRDYPHTAATLAEVWQRLALRFSLQREQVKTLWDLLGNQTADVLRELTERREFSSQNFTGTDILRCIVPWLARHEWVETLEDLVERRLMLVFHPRLSRGLMNELADDLISAKLLSSVKKDITVNSICERLQTRFGRTVE